MLERNVGDFQESGNDIKNLNELIDDMTFLSTWGSN